VEITQKDLEVCLERFNVKNTIVSWDMLADGPDHPVPYDVIRKIIYIRLDNGSSYVIKFIREEVFPTEIIESQSAFSDLLGEHGIRTPKRIKKDGCYCISFEKEGLRMDVTIEEWLGQKIPHLTLPLFSEVGRIMGKMHRISLLNKPKIGFSLLYNEILQKDTSYERLWGRVSHDFIPQDDYEEILCIYNSRLENVKKIWTQLPKSAVQGDIYSCNNLAIVEDELAVYDFNLAGDEVLMGDFFLCWFRTIYDERIESDLKLLNENEMWKTFLTNYEKERPFTEIEKKYMPDVYALLGTVYFTKMMVCWVATGRKNLAEQNYRKLFSILKTEKGQDPCMIVSL
jgi:Ser/Thr protein kinase RdoA (MazF antagonist)